MVKKGGCYPPSSTSEAPKPPLPLSSGTSQPFNQDSENFGQAFGQAGENYQKYLEGELAGSICTSALLFLGPSLLYLLYLAFRDKKTPEPQPPSAKAPPKISPKVSPAREEKKGDEEDFILYFIKFFGKWGIVMPMKGMFKLVRWTWKTLEEIDKRKR